MTRLVLKSLQRHLSQGRALFLFTIVGVALGVASVVAIQTLNQGAMQAFDGSVRAVSGQAELSVLGTTTTFDERHLISVLADPAVDSAWPLIRLQAVVAEADGLFIDLIGADLLTPARWPVVRAETSDAPLDAVLDAVLNPGWLSLTPEFAEENGWAVGDTLHLSTGTRLGTFVVGALVDFQSLEPLAPHNLALVDIATAQSRLGRIGRVSQIDVRLLPEANLEIVAARLAETLGPGMKVLTPEQRRQDAAGLLAAFRLNLTALSLISVFVGIFLVMTSVQANLARRRGEFGLLRCLGATPGQVVGLVLFETALTGCLGVALGIPLGYFLALQNLETVSSTLTNVYVLQGISTLQLGLPVVLLGLAVGLIGAVAGALWPALEMARRDTLELMSPVAAQQGVRRSAGRLSRIAMILSVAANLWFFTLGHDNPWGGFIYGGLLMLALPFCVPLVVQGLAGGVRPRSLGFRLSLRNLSARPASTSFAVAALAITVSMLVGITLLVGSFRTTLIRWLDVTLRAEVYVSTESWDRGGGEAFIGKDLIGALGAEPEVEAVEEQRRLRIALADGSREIWLNGIRMSGLTAGDLAARLPLLSGKPDEVAEALPEGGVVIGEPLARKGRLAVGDTLHLMAPTGRWSLPIIGVLQDFTSEGGTGFVMMETLHQAFPQEPTNNAALFLQKGADTEVVVQRLKQDYAGTGLLFRSNDVLRAEVLAVFDETFAVTRTLQTLALAIAVLGVAMNLLVQTRERAGELALLRSLGASRFQVFRLFVGEGVAMGVAGLGMGLLGGVGLAALLILVVNRHWFGWTIDPAVPVADLAWQAGLVLGASVLAGLYPASRAHLVGPQQLTRDNQ